jgi:hypothetical protein
MGHPDPDPWLPRPSVRIVHARHSHVEPERLWEAARGIRLDQTRLLGRLVRWRIPGVPPQTSFDALFRQPPFCVLQDDGLALLSGLVGRIWTLRRDYPRLGGPEEFRAWEQDGTAKVLFANWVEADGGGASLCSETRVRAFGLQGRLGLRSVRPLIATFHHLVATDAMALAIRDSEQG